MKKNLSFLLFSATLALYCLPSCKPQTEEQQQWAIVLHGGAGSVGQGISPERQALYEEHLTNALNIGKDILKNGGTSLDAVEAVVRYMEDCPLFNAGHGAVLTAEGKHELDAAIMDGSNLMAGAIAGVTDIKNPISTARMVMERTPHVLLIGTGASAFARENGAEMVENEYFSTPARLEEKAASGRQKAEGLTRQAADGMEEGSSLGTVGCAALDTHGNLAAATSTGGMGGKMWGRVGDVPIVGAGTYANNNTVAISGTGHGELWIRQVVAYQVSALMEFKGLSVQEAAQEVIWNKIDKMEGSGGGIICVDKHGNVALVFNTEMMHRGWALASGEWGVAVM